MHMLLKVILITSLISSARCGAVGHGFDVESSTDEPAWSSLLGQQKALLIGIDKYQHARQLPNCVFDCRALASILKEKYGFSEIVEVYDEKANEDGILGALRDMASTLTEDQSLLVYFSGHGTKDDFTGDAFWVPVDGQSEGDYIPSDRIQRMIRATKARHVWVVCDSCFSGRLFAEKGVTIDPVTGGLDRYAEEALKKKSRLIMSSGGDEPVTAEGFEGHSVFAHYFLNALENPPRNWTDSSQVFNQIKVDIARNAKQTPQLGAIYDTDHRGGEFVLVARRHPEGTVSGTLIDDRTGRPLFPAYVWLVGADERVRLNTRGEFELLVSAGAFTALHIEREPSDGVYEFRLDISVEDGDNLSLGSLLVPSDPLPTPTPEIHIVGRSEMGGRIFRGRAPHLTRAREMSGNGNCRMGASIRSAMYHLVPSLWELTCPKYQI